MSITQTMFFQPSIHFETIVHEFKPCFNYDQVNPEFYTGRERERERDLERDTACEKEKAEEKAKYLYTLNPKP
jgi:hypothetical protein